MKYVVYVGRNFVRVERGWNDKVRANDSLSIIELIHDPPIRFANDLELILSVNVKTHFLRHVTANRRNKPLDGAKPQCSWSVNGFLKITKFNLVRYGS